MKKRENERQSVQQMETCSSLPLCVFFFGFFFFFFFARPQDTSLVDLAAAPGGGLFLAFAAAYPERGGGKVRNGPFLEGRLLRRGCCQENNRE